MERHMINISMQYCLILFWLSTCMASDVYSSVEHLEILASGEPLLLTALDKYIEAEERKLEAIEEKLERIASVHRRPGANDSYAWVGHPLNAFHLIKRYVHVWNDVFALMDDFEHQKELKHAADLYKPYLPQERDYEGALMAVLRLQRTYGLRTGEVAEGWLLHRRAAPLGNEHMYDLGVAALHKLHDPELAEEWLQMAKNVERPPVADLNNGDEVFRTVRDKNRERRARGEDISPKLHPTVQRYRELCRDSVYKPYVPAVPLTCFYYTTRLAYVPYKVEVVSSEPDVALIYDFVSDEEAGTLTGHVLNTMERAKVGLNEEARASEVRVSKVAFLWDKELPLVADLSQRIGHVTGLNVTMPSAEPLQLVNYGIGGHFDPHHDFDINRHNRATVPDDLLQLGDRIATLMIYLNDVELGGATVFPVAGVYIKPVKNAALFWYNYDLSGAGDLRTLHGACPVILGHKWIANKWFREHGQELVQPCPASQTDQ